MAMTLTGDSIIWTDNVHTGITYYQTRPSAPFYYRSTDFFGNPNSTGYSFRAFVTLKASATTLYGPRDRNSLKPMIGITVDYWWLSTSNPRYYWERASCVRNSYLSISVNCEFGGPNTYISYAYQY